VAERDLVFARHEEFSLLPGKGKVALEGFKAGILAGGGGKRILPDLAVTRNEAAAAFLALQLAHCLGWYEKTQPLGGRRGQKFPGYQHRHSRCRPR
jgi:hypothetical protein